MPTRQAPLAIIAGVPAAEVGDRPAEAGADLRVEVGDRTEAGDRAAVAGVRLAEAGADIAGTVLIIPAAEAGVRVAARLRPAEARADTSSTVRAAEAGVRAAVLRADRPAAP